MRIGYMAEEVEGAIGADWAMGAEGAMGSEGVMGAEEDKKGAYTSSNLGLWLHNFGRLRLL